MAASFNSLDLRVTLSSVVPSLHSHKGASVRAGPLYPFGGRLLARNISPEVKAKAGCDCSRQARKRFSYSAVIENRVGKRNDDPTDRHRNSCSHLANSRHDSLNFGLPARSGSGNPASFEIEDEAAASRLTVLLFYLRRETPSLPPTKLSRKPIRQLVIDLEIVITILGYLVTGGRL